MRNWQGRRRCAAFTQCAREVLQACEIVPNMNLESYMAEQDANLECHRDRLFTNDCYMRAQVLALS
jgi:hypothetical protein